MSNESGTLLRWRRNLCHMRRGNAVVAIHNARFTLNPMNTYLICYDIEDDRERASVARLLESYGERVQYSVFEVHLRRPADLDGLKTELRDRLSAPDAEVRFYRLTADGIAASHRLDGSPIAHRDLVVIL